MIRLVAGLLLLLVHVPAAGQADAAAPGGTVVRVSPRDSRYLELSDGAPYIPIGLNMIAGGRSDADQSLATMIRWMDELARNDGNFFRIWLGHADWDVENERAGVFDPSRAERIDRILDEAQRRRLRVKMTLEHFRHFDENPRWSAKPIYHRSRGGVAENVQQYLTGEPGREHFRRKLDWYSARYRDHPAIFAWELWNEINAVEGGGVTLHQTAEELEWTRVMLQELRRRFPNHLVTQSLGSFDDARVREPYRVLSRMAGNDLAQVHRYLDLGARLDVAHGPVDVLAADAVRELVAFRPGRPVLLAEGGAVEPSHSGPFRLYRADREGTILHDILFAPFFAGAAGPGQIWHWGEYVDANRLWFHFARFAESVRGVDPPAERFQPRQVEHPRLRVYALVGENTTLLWARDSRNDWRSELERGEAPPVVRAARIDAAGLGIGRAMVARTYDPWTDRWARAAVREGRIVLPDFTRSIVVRIDRRR